MRDHGAGAPGHRWTVTVVLLVALASLPTLAAVSAGTATLGRPAESDGTTPFIAQPSDAPVVIVPQRPAVLPERDGSGADAQTGPGPRRTGRPDRQRDERVVVRRQPSGGAHPGPVGGTAPEPAACARPAVLGWRPLSHPRPPCPDEPDTPDAPDDPERPD